MAFLLQIFQQSLSLLSHTLFTSPTTPSQELYPFLMLGDTLYYLYSVAFLSSAPFYQSLISLLLSLTVLFLYYLLGVPRVSLLGSRKNQIQRYIFIIFNFLHLLVGLDQSPEAITLNNPSSFQTEVLWRFLFLESLGCSFFQKLIFGIFCLKIHAGWKSHFDIRLLCTMLSIISLMSAWKVRKDKRKREKQLTKANSLEEIHNEKFLNETQNLSLLKVSRDRSRSQTRYIEKDSKLLSKILNQMPEGVIVLDVSGRVKYMNSYMKNIFEFEEGISLQELSQNLSKFEFKEASVQMTQSIPNNNKRSTTSEINIEEEEHFSITSESALDEQSNKLTREDFLKKVQKISSLQDLFISCMEEPETREASLKYVPTFQTRYSHQHDNETYSMEVKAHLIIENINERYLIILWRDTTERENKIICLEEEHLNFKNNVLASFSHELRTPLNANLAFLEQSMELEDIPRDIKERLIRPAWISGKLLFFLIKDILDYSQTVLNRFDLHIESRNIAQTVHQCIELFQQKITKKKLRLNLNIDKKIPTVIFTDHDRFSQILINLLSNAVKFTFQGSIDITLSATPQNTILVSVKDTGIGMEEISQKRLKRKFAGEVLNERISYDSVGIGIGSFIANKLAVKLSPREEIGLEFLSKKGKGSHFYFEIENKKAKSELGLGSTMLGDIAAHQFDTEEQCSVSRTIQDHHTHVMKNSFQLSQRNIKRNMNEQVLVVDDEIFNIIVIENFCKSFGIKVDKAFHGEEALHKLKSRQQPGGEESPVKMVFMDINMPVMDGYQASLRIQEMIRRRQIPNLIIVGVTAYVSDELIDKCYRCGMSEVLNKPLSKETLANVLRKYNVLD